ncbi:tRNA (guanine-N(7)-)-methyltransferase [Stieleria neptunia]|uniref:tRNA (Guanine-N(7)-)-methyltransferase n=1 Tax=Stieleria neptunia TaxID=2527979 RepID=A0A518HN00_9BACT|nr:class I SAM-dependent methyltransferase [Stieleria neptunia]QDV42200.1 tRNA (guanine-N(7)-)-methyltransferase [Stieleria neptunia]
MSSESTQPFSYDEFPYASYPYASSHPRNLAALAQLFALQPADVSRCRVLEIGCAAGGNLIPMAARFPESQFLGLDASKRQIDEGRPVIEALSLTNITLRHQDILEFDSSEGKFDFIICHGVYSWVPPEVQAKILSVCRHHLAENGVAYISYNTYPGWYLRRGVREMMSYHASGFDDTQTKIDQSRALVDFLVSAVQSNHDAYEKLLHEELSIVRASEDSYIYHEHLEDYNEPLFFHQFVSRAEENDLRFMCEAQFASMIPNEYGDETRGTLSKIAPGLVQMEQYLDFLRNRKFRQTLLCHREAQPNRAIGPARLKHLYVNSPLAEQESEDADASANTRVFEHASGRTLTVGNPVQIEAFRHLASIWPSDVSIDALADIARDAVPAEQRPGVEECRDELYETFLELYSSGLVALYAAPSGCSVEISATPGTSDLIRHQAEQGGRVTNLRHESVHLDDFEREIIKRLDGVATIDQIAAGLLEFGVAIQVESPDAESPDPETELQPVTPTQEQLRAVVEQKLKRFAHTGLLTP